MRMLTLPRGRPCFGFQFLAVPVQARGGLYEGAERRIWEIAIVHVNAEKWSGLVEGFRILNVPTLVYLKDGKEVARQNLIRGKGEVLIKFEEPREL